MSTSISKLSAEQTSEAMGYAHRIVADSLAGKFKPVFGASGLETHFVGKLGEVIARDMFVSYDLDVRATPLRDRYDRLSPTDDFVLRIDGKDVKVEIKTASVFKSLDNLPPGFRFMLNAAQRLRHGRPFNWDWVVSIFVNLTDLTYRIMGCVEVDHVDVYPIAGSYGTRHYEIPPEFLLPVECIWEECAWKDA